jgi:hypothetical protein
VYSFAIKKEIGEVVFSLRIAYQAINTKLEPDPPGSYYNDVCNFITDLVRERSAHNERVRAERARKQQAHRQELQDARDAAEALQKLKKSKPKACHLFKPQNFFLTLYTCQPKKPSNNKSSMTIVVSDGDQSDDYSDAGSILFLKGKSKVKDSLPKEPSAKEPSSKDPLTGEGTDAMVVDEPAEVRPALYTRQLERQLKLIIGILQLNAASASSTTPNSIGE